MEDIIELDVEVEDGKESTTNENIPEGICILRQIFLIN